MLWLAILVLAMGAVKSKQSDASEMSASRAAAFIRNEIASNGIVIFSKTYCPYCRNAKAAFASAGVSKGDPRLVIHELDLLPGGDEEQEEYQKVLGEITGGRTVPRVFVGGKFIGGGDDTVKLMKSGKLKEMVDALA